MVLQISDLNLPALNLMDILPLIPLGELHKEEGFGKILPYVIFKYS